MHLHPRGGALTVQKVMLCPTGRLHNMHYLQQN